MSRALGETSLLTFVRVVRTTLEIWIVVALRMCTCRHVHEHGHTHTMPTNTISTDMRMTLIWA